MEGGVDFEILADIIENKIGTPRIKKIDGVWNRISWYKMGNLIFELNHNDDIGNYIKMSNVESLKTLEIFKDNEKALEIFREYNNSDNINQKLYDLALEITNYLNKRIKFPSDSYKIDNYISLELWCKEAIILIDGKCTELYLLEID